MSGEFNDVMIDIESMSLHPHNALILSIGAVEFDATSPDGLRLGSRLLIVPSIEEQLLLGREVNASTQEFWAKQPPEASAHWRDYTGERSTVHTIGKCLHSFLGSRKRVWANHILFDLGNLAGLCAQAGLNTPWHYRAPYDMPSFCNEHPLTNGNWHKGDFHDDDDPRCLPTGLVDHHPVDDSIRQAYTVWQHWPAAL